MALRTEPRSSTGLEFSFFLFSDLSTIRSSKATRPSSSLIDCLRVIGVSNGIVGGDVCREGVRGWSRGSRSRPRLRPLPWGCCLAKKSLRLIDCCRSSVNWPKSDGRMLIWPGSRLNCSSSSRAVSIICMETGLTSVTCFGRNRRWLIVLSLTTVGWTLLKSTTGENGTGGDQGMRLLLQPSVLQNNILEPFSIF